MWEEYEGRTLPRNHVNRGNGRRKRRRRRRKRIMRIVIFAALAVVLFTLVKSLAGGNVRTALMAVYDERARQLLLHSDEYPEELRELLAMNEEAADFVLDYPAKKDAPPAETVGEVTPGTIPLLLQWDERWGVCVIRRRDDRRQRVRSYDDLHGGGRADRRRFYHTVQGGSVCGGKRLLRGRRGDELDADDRGSQTVRRLRGGTGTEPGSGIFRARERPARHMQHETGRFHHYGTFYRADGSGGWKDTGERSQQYQTERETVGL